MRHPGRPLSAVLAVLALGLSAWGPQAASATTGAPGVVPGVIEVATTGVDTWSREVALSRPVAGIARAVRLARPGDTIVVRGGVYDEAVGWGAVPGSPDRRITLRNHPGERVVLRGTLQLEGADHWTVRGITVTGGPRRTEFLVKFDGGTGWQFLDAEVRGARGVSSVMVSSSAEHGLPRDYRIARTCIHHHRATGDPFMNDHGIYLMPGAGSGPGLIERNVFFDIPNGAAIKAAGPSAGTGAAGRVTIRRNTIVRAAAGVIVGHGSHDVLMHRNLIGAQLIRPPAGSRWVRNYDAAVIGNHVTGAGNRLSSTLVWGYDRVLHATDDSRPITRRGNRMHATRFERPVSCTGLRPTTPLARGYGRYS